MPYIAKHNKRKVTPLDNSFNKYQPEVVARPVDTYVHHEAVDEGANYRALSAALSGISPAINRYLMQRHKEQVAADEAKGEKLYHTMDSDRQSWKDFREKNDEALKKAGVNVSVRNGYLKARMANEANIFKENLYAEYQSGKATVTLPDGSTVPVAESDDPSVFNLWLNRATREFIKTNLGMDADPEYFSKIFVPQLEQTANEITAQHLARRREVLDGKAMAEQNKLMGNIVSEGVKGGNFTDVGEDLNDMADRISSSIRELTLSGVEQGKAVHSVVKALIAKAEDETLENGEDIVYLAKKIKLPDGSSLWDYANNEYEFAGEISRIQSNRWQRRARMKQDDEDQRNRDFSMLYPYVAARRPIPKDVEAAMIMKYGFSAYSSFTSAARNTVAGYLPKPERSGGGGAGRAPSDAMLERQRKRYADSLVKEVQLGNFAGSLPSLEDVVKDPRFQAMNSSETGTILSFYGAEGEEMKKNMDFASSESYRMIEDIVKETFPEMDRMGRSDRVLEIQSRALPLINKRFKDALEKGVEINDYTRRAIITDSVNALSRAGLTQTGLYMSEKAAEHGTDVETEVEYQKRQAIVKQAESIRQGKASQALDAATEAYTDAIEKYKDTYVVPGQAQKVQTQAPVSNAEARQQQVQQKEPEPTTHLEEAQALGI